MVKSMFVAELGRAGLLELGAALLGRGENALRQPLRRGQAGRCQQHPKRKKSGAMHDTLLFDDLGHDEIVVIDLGRILEDVGGAERRR